MYLCTVAGQVRLTFLNFVRLNDSYLNVTARQRTGLECLESCVWEGVNALPADDVEGLLKQ